MKVVALAGIVLCAAAAAYAQGADASLSGRVLDSSGAVIPGAELQLRNTGTNQMRTVKSGAEGEYVFLSLDPGSYELIATHGGFQRHVETAVNLEVGQAAHLDVKLDPGSLAETVEVTASAFRSFRTSSTRNCGSAHRRFRWPACG